MDKETDITMRSSAQGLFMMMTNGIGAAVGSWGAKEIINHFVYTDALNPTFMSLDGWRTSWYIFAGYALVVAVAFAILFEYKHVREEEK